MYLFNSCSTFLEADRREIEVELLPIDDFSFGGHRASLVVRPPTGLEIVRQVNTAQPCLTVCQYKVYTFFGLCGGRVDRIDEQGSVTSSFIEASSHVISIRAHKDRLYMIVYGEPYKVCVYDMAGQCITSWDHAGTPNRFGLLPLLFGNKVSVIRDQLVAFDETNKRVTLYTLNGGDIVRHINCPFLGDSNIAMCEAGCDSVIITDSASSKVFRLNLVSGEIEWESANVPQPIGVVCYGKEFVLVSTRSTMTQVWMLNVRTGRL